ncbi:sepiapterin reductase a [Thalassophryne amazonica]|uniref:sepiapterin reductase a n=1 Tax=Thalassophryne amazonica TaxID=390379 RepID=UPI0014713875|nr:sepiapterin reductase a [Thalassophryne amazonica]
MQSAAADLGRALCIITGASRGFGRTVSRQVSRLLKPGSVLVLAARSAENLRAVQAELAASEVPGAGLEVRCVPADLGLEEGVEKVVKTCREVSAEDIDHIILINNAGSLGDVSRYFIGFTNMAEVDSFLSLNISSCLCLTAGVLQAFPQRPGLRRTVVNVTSICGISPYRTWVLYCTAKAAREMMFRVLAEEQPNVRVLNYAPGPLDTDMLSQAKERTADPDLQRLISDLYANGQVLTCDTSCSKLLKLLLDDGYTSGAHVDFFDE